MLTLLFAIYSVEDKSHQCAVQGTSQRRQRRSFIIWHTHTHTHNRTHMHNKHVWDKAIRQAMDRYSMRDQQQVVPWGSRWSYVDLDRMLGCRQAWLICSCVSTVTGGKRIEGKLGTCICLCVNLSKVNCCTPLLLTYVLIPVLCPLTNPPKNRFFFFFFLAGG